MKRMIGYTMLGMGLGASMSFMYDKYKNNSLKSTFQKAGNKVSNMTPSSLGKSMRTSGYRGIGDAISTMDPTKNIYRRRYSRRQ